MKKDSILMIVSVSGLAALFLLGVVFPGRRANARIQQEITAAEQAIRSIPVRVAELKCLQQQIAQHESYLAGLKPSIPDHAGTHGVLEQVATVAAQTGVRVTRLEPLAPVEHESYTGLPFRLTLRGPYPAVAGFLRGLETQSRLFAVEDLSIRLDEEAAAEQTTADVHFSVYVIRSDRADSADSAESNASAARRRSDTRYR